MNKKHARRIALDWLYYACYDPETFFHNIEDDIPPDEDVDAARDKILDAFYVLKQEFARRTGRAKDG